MDDDEDEYDATEIDNTDQHLVHPFENYLVDNLPSRISIPNIFKNDQKGNHITKGYTRT